jgi:hypothetical protein
MCSNFEACSNVENGPLEILSVPANMLSRIILERLRRKTLKDTRLGRSMQTLDKMNPA